MTVSTTLEKNNRKLHQHHVLLHFIEHPTNIRLIQQPHLYMNAMHFCSSSQTRGLSHCGLAIYMKTYLKAREELWKLKYFTMQKHNLHKILSMKPKSF